MNKFKLRFSAYIYGFLFLFLGYQSIQAQCEKVNINLTRTNSTCLSNGTITVSLSGDDLVNIRQSDMQFEVTGTQNHSFTHYSDNVIRNLPAGTYTIKLRAFCLAANNNEGDWVVFNNSASITLTSSYTEMQAIAGTPRKTLNCIPTGMIPITIKDGAGPYTITMTSSPSEYTGATEFTTATAGIYEVKNLPAGSYTFTVSDNCSYAPSVPAVSVGTMETDFPTNWFHMYLYPVTPIVQNGCDLVGLRNQFYSSSFSADERHYFYTNVSDYYELSFFLNSTGAKNDVVFSNFSSDIRLTLPSPHTMKSIRAARDTIIPYVRIKNTTCDSYFNGAVADNTMYHSTSYTDVGCDSVTVSFTPYTDYDGMFCYPYEWRILRADSTEVMSWQGPIPSRTTQKARVPLGSIIQYRDSEGYIWTQNVTSSAPVLFISQSGNPCYNHLVDSVFATDMYLYLSNSATMPVGTRIEFVSGPVGGTPIHTDVTLTAPLRYFYPYTTDYTYSPTSEYRTYPMGTYTFRITIPGCASQTKTYDHYFYKLKEPLSYTTHETCGGLQVIPSGRISYVNSSGSESNQTTYFMIYSTDPTDIPFDQSIVKAGETLFLPTTGEYRIAMSRYNSRTNCPSMIDTIHYTKTLFSLNPAVTTAHVCKDAGVGFIRVGGMGGSGQYKYVLYDGTQEIETNTTGKFDYGTAGSTYKIKLIDTDPDCAASYEQHVQMIDLGIAQIVYSSSPTNTFCLQDSVYLKCITLGDTRYEWTGPGLTNGKDTLQNPVIAASDLGLGTHTYTITVRPEGCGSDMSQSITITVEDCTGARDDYRTIFVNSIDSVDVLANDAYRAACIGSVTPEITVSPQNGTAHVENKKIVYKPNTNFAGHDSLTYKAVCSGETSYAKVYIHVIDYPDNVVDAGCTIDPPGKAFSFSKLMESPTQYSLSNLSIPLVGDIDNDGIVEVIVRGGANAVSTPDLYIFKVKNNQLELMQKLVTPQSNNIGNSYAIAKVDANEYAAIFVCSQNEWVPVANDKQRLLKYVYNPATKLYEEFAVRGAKYSHLTNKEVPQPMIVDFNGDGIPEVVVYDKVYNARTMELLVDGNLLSDPTMGFGFGGHPNTIHATEASSIMAVADIDNDGVPEVIGGNTVYKVNITNPNGTAGNTFTMWKQCDRTDEQGNVHGEAYDGATSVADMDGDGLLDVVVTVTPARNTSSSNGALYVWNPRTGKVMHTNVINNIPAHPTSHTGGPSVTFIGDIDNDKQPEICFTGVNLMYAFEYDPQTQMLTEKWRKPTTDASGATTMVMFDFNQDGKQELVYRDHYNLRIIDGTTGNDLISPISCSSATANEFPIVADVNNDGAAEIVVTGDNRVWIFSSSPAGTWAPARPVWNQFAYNSVNINSDLTVPRYQLNPATRFPGKNGIMGDNDDVYPYNGYLMQQTTLNTTGTPLWLAPDVYPEATITGATLTGNTVDITVGIINQGDAAIGKPVYAALYIESVSLGNFVMSDSADIQILPGDTGYVYFQIPDITVISPTFNFAIRVNDNGVKFMYQEECNSTNNVITIVNPALHLYMKKDATLLLSPPVQHNGTLPNPVSVLFSENIKYEITAMNVSAVTAPVQIRDTLPAYLKYNTGSENPSTNFVKTVTASGTPVREILTWNVPDVAAGASTTVSFEATPVDGSCASQPLYINKAWITVGGLQIPTGNSTYHQGAGVGIATFSAGWGGQLYNAEPQAVDYRTSARSGVLVVPDEGYQFDGWSHEAYTSLRGDKIDARKKVMSYDTLTIFGSVDLQAHFSLEKYPVRYFLHGALNAAGNPETYTIETGTLTLEAPEKIGDVFTGWTGSNGDQPQPTVTIPKGSTGELEFYANFLHSGRESEIPETETTEDRIWAFKSDLYIRTSNVGSTVRIYSVDGVLVHRQEIHTTGETKIQLPRGLYIVTLNNDIGQKINID